MKTPAFTNRHWISIGLCILGLVGMPILNLYFNKNLITAPLSFLVPFIVYQWLPFTALLLLIAAYVWPDKYLHSPGWLVFIVGMLLSGFSYFLVLSLH
jgi:hypothetical protein